MNTYPLEPNRQAVSTRRGYDPTQLGSVTPINRPRAARRADSDVTEGLTHWHVPGTSTQGWTDGCPIKAARDAQRSTDAIMTPGDTMSKLNALIARFGKEVTAQKIGIGTDSMRDWLSGHRGPGKKAQHRITHVHYSAKLKS